MSMTDLVSPTPAVTPAVEAKVYDLKYITQAHFDGDNKVLRGYFLLDPYRETEDGGEVKPDITGQDRVEIPIPNVHDLCRTTPEQDALIQQTLGAYLAQGGNLFALTMVGMIISVNAYGKQTGALKPDPVPVEPPVEPVPEEPV